MLLSPLSPRRSCTGSMNSYCAHSINSCCVYTVLEHSERSPSLPPHPQQTSSRTSCLKETLFPSWSSWEEGHEEAGKEAIPTTESSYLTVRWISGPTSKMAPTRSCHSIWSPRRRCAFAERSVTHFPSREGPRYARVCAEAAACRGVVDSSVHRAWSLEPSASISTCTCGWLRPRPHLLPSPEPRSRPHLEALNALAFLERLAGRRSTPPAASRPVSVPQSLTVAVPLRRQCG